MHNRTKSLVKQMFFSVDTSPRNDSNFLSDQVQRSGNLLLIPLIQLRTFKNYSVNYTSENPFHHTKNFSRNNIYVNFFIVFRLIFSHFVSESHNFVQFFSENYRQMLSNDLF